MLLKLGLLGSCCASCMSMCSSGSTAAKDAAIPREARQVKHVPYDSSGSGQFSPRVAEASPAFRPSPSRTPARLPMDQPFFQGGSPQHDDNTNPLSGRAYISAHVTSQSSLPTSSTVGSGTWVNAAKGARSSLVQHIEAIKAAISRQGAAANRGSTQAQDNPLFHGY